MARAIGPGVAYGVPAAAYTVTPPPEALLVTPPPEALLATAPPDVPTAPPAPSAAASAGAAPGAGATPCAPALPSVAPVIPTSSCFQALLDAIGDGNSIAGNVTLLLNAARQYGVTDPAQVAYILATVKTETNYTFLYEIADGSPATTYFNAKYKDTNGNTQPTDGYTYRGRGFVQITGRGNYAKLGSALGIDLVDNPDLAASPAIAAQIAVLGMRDGLFTGVSLSTYFANGKQDWYNARRIVNGTDKADQIAADAQKIYSVLQRCPSL
jgi:predicted chitinase